MAKSGIHWGTLIIGVLVGWLGMGFLQNMVGGVLQKKPTAGQ